MVAPSRGEVWLAHLSPVVGHEQAGSRPVLVISATLFNQGRADLVFVFAVPLTRTEREIPRHVSIVPPEGGLRQPSFAMCEMTRSISEARLQGSPWGKVTPETMTLIEDRLRVLLEL